MLCIYHLIANVIQIHLSIKPLDCNNKRHHKIMQLT